MVFTSLGNAFEQIRGKTKFAFDDLGDWGVLPRSHGPTQHRLNCTKVMPTSVPTASNSAIVSSVAVEPPSVANSA